MIQGTDKIQDFIREASSFHVVNVVFLSELIFINFFFLGVYIEIAKPNNYGL